MERTYVSTRENTSVILEHIYVGNKNTFLIETCRKERSKEIKGKKMSYDL
jgi:hypothetical protein